MPDQKSSKDTYKSKWTGIVSGSILAGLIVTYFAIPEVKSTLNEAFNVLLSQDEQRISIWVSNFGIWGPVFIVLAMIIQMFLIIIPSPVLMVVAVLAYGPVWGAVISISAIFAASSVGFFVGRYFGKITVDKLIGQQKKQKIEFYIHKYGMWAVVIIRLVPALSNDAISFVGGILRMGYKRFIIATLIGTTPLAVLIAYFGENNERLRTGLIWLSAISLLIFISYLVNEWKRNKESGK
ncbi:MAG: TVP38/TMEM64 family protein [Bacteroidota bacterium]